MGCLIANVTSNDKRIVVSSAPSGFSLSPVIQAIAGLNPPEINVSTPTTTGKASFRVGGVSVKPIQITMVCDAVINSISVEKYLTIRAREDGLTASLASDNVFYCIDGSGDWVELSAGTKTPAINTGQTLSFKANYTSYNTARRFSISKKCDVLGDPMSLYYGSKASKYDTMPYNYSFAYLFYRVTTIVDASELKLDRKLKQYAYYYMFQGCTALITPPELPQTTLQNSCYRRMFQGCTAMTTAPVLPALVLKNNCYEYMLTSCNKFRELTMLATDISATNCLLGWVNAVRSSGTFYKNKDATWTTTGVSGVPSGWTVVLV